VRTAMFTIVNTWLLLRLRSYTAFLLRQTSNLTTWHCCCMAMSKALLLTVPPSPMAELGRKRKRCLSGKTNLNLSTDRPSLRHVTLVQ
jgi:hypothetical protein